MKINDDYESYTQQTQEETPDKLFKASPQFDFDSEFKQNQRFDQFDN